jgi:hypothetical protein
MELIIISESKMKLMLSPDDMAFFTPDRSDTGTLLRCIMTEACAKCGLNPPAGRLFVQMYPSKEGGCELFVTQLGEKKPKMQAAEERTLTEYRRFLYRDRGGHIIYAFEEMSYLLRCCSGLYRSGYNGSSRAYHDPDKKKYYLRLDCETPVAGENFGVRCPSNFYYYINEHCDIMCRESAVETLGILA